MRVRPPAPQGGYLADLSNPGDNPFMTTCADADCRHSYIDPHPASGLARPMSYAELKARLANLVGGKPVNPGPRVTFVNDNPKNPSPNQPLTTPTARMVAAAILQSGADAVNINSTTGGIHGDRSLHYRAQAVDMNRVNGRKVTPANPARFVQDAALSQPNIAEDYGPSYQLNDKGRGREPVRSRKVIQGHQDHLHIGGDR